MMETVEFSKARSPVHPTGLHKGTIVAVDDRGMKETAYGPKHKITVRVESADDSRHRITQWFSLSDHRKSNLTKFREMVLGREMTDKERGMFNPNSELVGRSVSYEVIHIHRGACAYADIVEIHQEVIEEVDPFDTTTEDLPF
jgi:hypothetical protein